MANIKNFGLVGVGSDLQFGKSGTRLVNNEGIFNFKASNGTSDAAITLAGITSSAGNVTLTTGNVVLTDAAGKVTIGGTDMLQKNATTGNVQISGTSSVVLPTGDTAARGTAELGAFRVNSDSTSAAVVEYYNGTNWTSLATGGEAVTSVTGTTDRITSTGGTTPVIDIASTYVGQSSITTLGTVTTGTWTAGVIGATYGGTGLSTFAAGTVLYASGADTWAAAAPGETSGVQAYDAGLAALAAKTTTGIMVQTGDDTFVSRTIEGTAANIVVTNGDGLTAAAIAINLAEVIQDTTGTFSKVTLDTFGRVIGNTAVTTADITGLVNSEYLRLDGTTTMTAALNAGGFAVTNVATPTSPTDAANKSYVDNAVTGLTWKNSAQVLVTTNVTISGPGASVDGVTLTAGDRVLLTGQTTTEENGIYVFNGDAVAMTRSTDADVYQELNGAALFIQQGTYADSAWTQTTELTSFVGQTWVQFSGAGAYSGGTGITVLGTTINADLGAGLTTLDGNIVVNIATGALSTSTVGTQLSLVLDGAGLEQSVSGLKISAAGVTNAMLANSVVTFTGTTGSDAVALGESMAIIGAIDEVVSTSMSDNSLTISVRDATNTLKGVASFAAANFDVATGEVSIKDGGIDLAAKVTGILPVANGGTGVSTLGANQVMLGNDTGTVLTSAALAFSAETLTVGTTAPLSISGATATIASTATNGNINIVPNGTGSVVIGTTGAGLIQSDTGTALTVQGNTTLTLTSVTGSTTMSLAADTTSKVTVTGPTAAQYATDLADADLVNKLYVDQVASAGGAGDVKAVRATFSLAAAGTFDVGSALPAGATILSVKAQVTAADTATGTLSVGKSGGASDYMTTLENDTQSTGMYLAETLVTEAGSVQVIGTVAGTPGGSGSVTVVVTYQLA